MVYRALADVVMVLHAALLVFFVVGGFLAWRWRRLIWAHLFVAAWNLSIVLLDFGCPVTAAEKWLRRRGGEQPYADGFIQHYIAGTIYPRANLAAELVGFAMLVVSYDGLLWIRFLPPTRRRRLIRTRDGKWLPRRVPPAGSHTGTRDSSCKDPRNRTGRCVL
jgi:hypothetical protein